MSHHNYMQINSNFTAIVKEYDYFIVNIILLNAFFFIFGRKYNLFT